MPIYLFSALLHLYVGWRLLPALGPVAQGLLLLVLVASTVLVPLGLLARRHVRGPAADRLALVGLLFMGLFSSLFVLTVLREHPLEFKRLKDSGELSKYLVDAPSPQFTLASKILGFFLIACGLTLLFDRPDEGVPDDFSAAVVPIVCH